MKSPLRILILTLVFAVNFLSAQQLVIPQVADGAGWKSTLVLTNTTAVAAVASMSFYKDTTEGATQTWTPTFEESGSTADLALPAGSTTFLHTPGTAGTLSQGWAQIIASSGVQSYVIYTYTSGGRASDATAPAVAPTSRILVPFDNTIGLVTALAVVNPNPISETISVNIKTAGGAVTEGSLPSLPANGQMAFVMTSQFPATANESGLAEFYTSSGSLSIIALRANPTGGLTSAPVYFETGSPIITAGTGSSGGGGGSLPAGDITFAGFTIGKIISSAGVQEEVGGQFAGYTPTEWNAPYMGTKIGPCTVWSVTYASSGKYPAAPDLFLDAGAKLSLSGPSLPSADTSVPSSSSIFGPSYHLSLPTGTLVDGGTYTLGGSGGTQVEGFSVPATLPSGFTTNLNTISAIDRTKPLTITWGGSGFENVILGVNGTTLSATSITQVVISCAVAASLGTYSIPTAALSLLPAVAAKSAVGIGSVTVSTVPAINGSFSADSSTDTSFTPNLVAGGKIEYGTFAPSYAVVQTVSIQ